MGVAVHHHLLAHDQLNAKVAGAVRQGGIGTGGGLHRQAHHPAPLPGGGGREGFEIGDRWRLGCGHRGWEAGHGSQADGREADGSEAGRRVRARARWGRRRGIGGVGVVGINNRRRGLKKIARSIR